MISDWIQVNRLLCVPDMGHFNLVYIFILPFKQRHNRWSTLRPLACWSVAPGKECRLPLGSWPPWLAPRWLVDLGLQLGDRWPWLTTRWPLTLVYLGLHPVTCWPWLTPRWPVDLGSHLCDNLILAYNSVTGWPWLTPRLTLTYTSVTRDLTTPSDWQVSFSQSALAYRHTSLDKPAGCPSNIAM